MIDFKKLFFKLIHLTGIFIFIYILYKTDIHSLYRTFLKIDIKNFVLTALLIPFLEIPRMFRFNTLLRIEGVSLDTRSLFLSYQSSIFFGNISPLRTGDFYKIRYLPISAFKGMILVMADRGFDFILLVVSGLYAFGVHQGSLYLRTAAILLTIVIILLFVFIRRFSQRIGFLDRTLKKLSLSVLLTGWTIKDAIKLSVYSAFAATLFFFFNYSIINLTMNTNVSFFDVIIIVSMVSLSNLIPITVSGIGTREALSLLIFSSYGMGKETAITYGALSFVLIMFVATIYSFFIWRIAEVYFKNTLD